MRMRGAPFRGTDGYTFPGDRGGICGEAADPEAQGECGECDADENDCAMENRRFRACRWVAYGFLAASRALPVQQDGDERREEQRCVPFCDESEYGASSEPGGAGAAVRVTSCVKNAFQSGNDCHGGQKYKEPVRPRVFLCKEKRERRTVLRDAARENGCVRGRAEKPVQKRERIKENLLPLKMRERRGEKRDEKSSACG